MRITLEQTDIEQLRPAILDATQKIVEELRQDNERIGYTEAEAAALLGVRHHVLRDCRLRGEIAARRVGKRYVYSRAALERFLSSSATG